MKIAYIGGGNMASALISGQLARGAAAADIRVAELSAEARAALAARYGIAVFDNIGDAVAGCDVAVLAVKPQQLAAVARELAPRLAGHLVVSIAAGVRVADLSRWLGGYGKIVRAMPNTPAMVQRGIAGLFAAPGLIEAERAQAGGILSAVGRVLWVAEEAQLDAVTAVSGSGPAYVFYFLQALQEGAEALGFSGEDAKALALETFSGACKLAAESTEDFATLRARVTSKGGTTERAVNTMEAASVRAAIVEGVKAARARAVELGDELGKAE